MDTRFRKWNHQLRGRIIPATDARLRFGMERRAYTDRHATGLDAGEFQEMN